MSELKDPEIKLFGKTISLPQKNSSSSSIHVDHHDDCQSSSNTAASEDTKNTLGEELTETKKEDDLSNPTAEESIQPASVSGIADNFKTSSAENETFPPKNTKNEELGDKNSSREKTLKKPDKILPCPRCNSTDTKFCYFNNYNVNQHRHFCRNCQRYWTAGGTMRNVPVGSGRRKNKNTYPSNYHHIMVSDALQAARGGVANGLHLPTLRANGTVLRFGSKRPICKSIANVLNLAERPHNRLPNGFHVPEQRFAIPCGGREIAKDHSTGSSTTISNSKAKGASAESVSNNCRGHLPAVRPFSCPPWPYPWNSAKWRSPLSPPALVRLGFSISFYPAPPFWGATAPSPSNMPWLSTASSSPDHSVQSTSPTFPTLGKHTRDEDIVSPPNLLKEEPFDRKIAEHSTLIPKKLRIDDPNEAVKRFVWSTLGIKNEAFPSKGDHENDVADTSLVLQANPAAFSRSQSFREST